MYDLKLPSNLTVWLQLLKILKMFLLLSVSPVPLIDDLYLSRTGLNVFSMKFNIGHPGMDGWTNLDRSCFAGPSFWLCQGALSWIIFSFCTPCVRNRCRQLIKKNW